MAADFKRLDVLIDAAGADPSEINSAVVELIDSGKVSLYDLVPLLIPLRKLSKALADIQLWSTDAQKPVLPPGQVVADVTAVEQGHGPIRTADMSHANWAYYQQHSLGAKWAQIFADNLDTVNAAIGALPGNLTQDGDGDPNVGNWSLASYL